MLSLEKDQKVIKKTAEVLERMGEGMSKSEAIMETDYRTALAESPKAVLATDAWKLVMEKYMPDEDLAERHRALLYKNEPNGQPDTQAVGKALELAYKIKGKLVDKVDVTSNGKALPATIVFNFKKNEEESKDVIVVPQS